MCIFYRFIGWTTTLRDLGFRYSEVWILEVFLFKLCFGDEEDFKPSDLSKTGEDAPVLDSFYKIVSLFDLSRNLESIKRVSWR